MIEVVEVLIVAQQDRIDWLDLVGEDCRARGFA
jgi:hypothetical protein